MKYSKTEIPDVWIIEPDVFTDSRGYFMESFKETEFQQHIGKINFIQENESYSSRNVLRGLHYQLAPWGQSKLLRVISGNVLDVAVDLRKTSPTFGKAVVIELSGENKKQLFIPQGFAHGFRVLSETAIFTYRVDNPYMPAFERTIRFDDPAIGINWQLKEGEEILLSDKDRKGLLLENAEYNF